jgi:hypothetical protein
MALWICKGIQAIASKKKKKALKDTQQQIKRTVTDIRYTTGLAIFTKNFTQLQRTHISSVVTRKRAKQGKK